jgi:hypothetical protein
VAADGAVDADSGHGPVFFRNVFGHYSTTLTEGSLRSAS